MATVTNGSSQGGMTVRRDCNLTYSVGLGRQSTSGPLLVLFLGRDELLLMVSFADVDERL